MLFYNLIFIIMIITYVKYVLFNNIYVRMWIITENSSVSGL